MGTQVDQEKLKAMAASYQEVNSIFWKNQAHNVEAYALMTCWRGVELIKSCLSGINGRKVIAPAISARSLLEPIGYIPPAEAEANYWQLLTNNEKQAAQLKPASLHKTRGGLSSALELIFSKGNSNGTTFLSGAESVGGSEGQ